MFEIPNQPGVCVCCSSGVELCSRSIHGLRRPRGDLLSIFGSPTAISSVSTRATTLPRDQIWIRSVRIPVEHSDIPNGCHGAGGVDGQRRI